LLGKDCETDETMAIARQCFSNELARLRSCSEKGEILEGCEAVSVEFEGSCNFEAIARQ
jgi:hypothetical protein